MLMNTRILTLFFLLILRVPTNASFLTQIQTDYKSAFSHGKEESIPCRLCDPFSTTGLIKEVSRISIRLDASRLEDQLVPIIDDDTFLLNLPVFPLRKKVRFPTDKMNLNLYEPRYLSLAERVLEQKQPIYGAIYCSHKPQMVSYGGLNPITPILEPGDVGILCEVYSSNTRPATNSNSTEDGDQLMENTSRTKEDKKRIQLSAKGIGRFRIKKIVQKGYDLKGMEDIGKDTLPYVVVEATLLRDDMCNNDEEKEKLHSLIQKYRGNILELTKDIDMIDFQKLNHPQIVNGDNTVNNALMSTVVEIATFALASKLVEKRSAQEMLSLLIMTSTLQRLEYVLKELRL